jgi:hypothetical protein
MSDRRRSDRNRVITAGAIAARVLAAGALKKPAV